MPTISAVRSTSARPIRHDVGPALINAVNTIGPNTDNPTIDRMAENISANLKRSGVKDTRWAHELLYQMRGTHLGVAGDRARFIANVGKGVKLGVIGPRGQSTLLSKVGAAAKAQDNRSAVENSIIKNQPQPRSRDAFQMPWFRSGSGDTWPDVFKPAQTSQRTTQRSTAVQDKPRVDVPTPKLDATIESLDKATKVMPDGVIKSSLSTVKASLELARTAEKRGDKVAYVKAIGSLAENMTSTIGEVVKRFGQDPALAEQAATQLGKIAGLLGKGVKAVGFADDLSKVLRGQSLGGRPASNGDRADAAINLVTTFLGPVGTGVGMAKAKLQWCYQHIGIPAKQALTEYGLKGLFAGRSPEQMREQIRALPANDPKRAQWVISKLFSDTFKNTSSGFSQATASSLWETFKRRELGDLNQHMSFLNEHAKTKPGEDKMVDLMRTRVAEAYQRAALRFVDAQVADAKGSWPV
ncbi:MAG: hypothetical protein Q8N26_06155 [Myxococcales bacterium]|nr:hypothetical protein [Myxococcales bacterium]